MRKKKDIGEAPLCACGCGHKVKRNPYGYARWNTFINGHNRKGQKSSEKQKKATSLAHKGIPLNISEETEKERRRKISEFQKGKPKSEEYKKMMSKLMQDKYNTDEEFRKLHKQSGVKISIKNKGKKSWSKGLTKETHPSIKAVSLKLIERFKDVNNCPSWQGGKSFEPYSREFNLRLKRKIKARDDYTCRECNKNIKNQDLHVHHIDYDKMNNDENNLITLCNSCHAKTIKAMTRNFYRMYYNYKMKKDVNYLINKFFQLGII